MGVELAFARRLESASAAATEALGEALGARLGPGDVVAVDGELGAGKTCFVRGLARGLGVTEGVSSPSYTLMHTYEGRLAVHHLDAWMQGRGDAFLADGGADWLRSDGVSVVEWSSRVAEWLPVPHLALALEHVGPERRRITLGAVLGPGGGSAGEGDRLRGLLEALVLPDGLREAP